MKTNKFSIISPEIKYHSMRKSYSGAYCTWRVKSSCCYARKWKFRFHWDVTSLLSSPCRSCTSVGWRLMWGHRVITRGAQSYLAWIAFTFPHICFLPVLSMMAMPLPYVGLAPGASSTSWLAEVWLCLSSWNCLFWAHIQAGNIRLSSTWDSQVYTSTVRTACLFRRRSSPHQRLWRGYISLHCFLSVLADGNGYILQGTAGCQLLSEPVIWLLLCLSNLWQPGKAQNCIRKLWGASAG